MKNVGPLRLRRIALFSTAFAAALAAGLTAPPPALALTPAVWDGSTGNWSNALHWSSNPAFPNDGGGIFYNATVNAGTVTVDGNFGVTDFTLAGGTLTGNNTLSASGALNFNGGDFGDGTATGTASGPLAINLISGQGLILPNYTVANTGAGSWTGTGALLNGGTLANSGTFNILNDQNISNFQATGTFSNTGTLTKTVATGTTSIGSIFNNTGGTVNVQSGTISLMDGGAATGNAQFGSTGSGTLSFDSGTFTMAGGTRFVGNGLNRVNGGTVAINGPVAATNLTLAGGTVTGNGTLTASGGLNFSGGAFGDGTATGTASGPLAINLVSGQGLILPNYTVANTGAGSWTGTGALLNGGTLANSGTFNIRNDQNISNFQATGTFNNTGTLTKTVATGTTSIGSIFNNTGGTLNVQSGTISLMDGGAATGDAQFGSTGSGTLSFDSGTFTMAGGTSFVGNGVNRVNGGTVAINGPVAATNLTLAVGTVTGNGALTASGGLNFNGGSFGDGTATGTASGPLAINLTASGQGLILPNYTVASSGAGSWTGTGTLLLGGTLANSGTFNIQNDQIITNYQAPGTFSNTGTLTKTVTTGTTSVVPIFNNAGGTVSVQSGTVSLQGGGAATGNAQFGSTGSGMLSFDSGTFTMAGGTRFVGNGVNRVNGGTVAINGPVAATNLTLAGGTVTGNGTLTASGGLNFNGGSFGDSTATGTASGPLAINLTASGQGLILPNYTVASSGAGGWTGTGTLFLGGTLANSGTFNIQNDQIINNYLATGTFSNSGTLTKTVTTGTTTIAPAFNNTGGTLNVGTGTVSLTGTVTNFNGTTNTLTDGTWLASGAGSTLSIDAGNGNRAINMLSGAADVTVGSATAAMTGLAITNIGSGSALRAIGGATIISGGPLTNLGTVEAGTGSTQNVSSAGAPALFTQNSGHLLLSGGTVTASAFNINGGEIQGSGQLTGGDFTAGGATLVSPGTGSSIGQILAGGAYTQTAGTGLFDLGRPGEVTAADLLAANGSISLSNLTITVGLLAGSAPLQVNDTFTLLESNFGNATGGLLTLTNDTFVVDSSLAVYNLTPVKTPTTYGYKVTTTPEPGSGIMAALGLSGLLHIRRRRR